MSRLLELDYSFVNKILLPGTGRKYSGSTSRGLVWLCNSSGHQFPNHYLRKSQSRHVILYCHGNGGTLGDFKAIVQYYFEWFSSSIFSIEYPSYGPAEGEAGEASVNDNLRTAYAFLVNELHYLPSNIILMGYSIGSGPVIQLASELCGGFGESAASPPLPPVPPAALITISAFMSVKDIIRDRQGGGLVSLLADSIENRWNSIERIKRVTCPTLLLHGLQDSLIPASHSQALFVNSGSLEKQLKMCPQADHCHFDEPGDTIQPIADFLSYVHNGLATPTSSYYDASSDGGDGGSGVSSAARGYPLPVPQSYYQCPASVREREEAAARKKRTAVSGSGPEGGAAMACMETTAYDVVGWFGSAGEAIVVGGVNTVVGGFNIATATASSGARTVAVVTGLSERPREESEKDDEEEEHEQEGREREFVAVRPSSSSSSSADSGTEFSRQPSHQFESSSSGSSSIGIFDRSAREQPAGSSRGAEARKSRSKSLVSEGSAVSGSSSSSGGGGPRPALSLSEQARKASRQAVAAINNYYAKLNAHDINAAVLLLSPDVQLTYSRPEELNRATFGRSAIKERLVNMLLKRPAFTAVTTILDIRQDSKKERTDDIALQRGGAPVSVDKVSVLAECEFSCSSTSYRAVRQILFVVRGKSICELHYS